MLRQLTSGHVEKRTNKLARSQTMLLFASLVEVTAFIHSPAHRVLIFVWVYGSLHAMSIMGEDKHHIQKDNTTAFDTWFGAAVLRVERRFLRCSKVDFM